MTKRRFRAHISETRHYQFEVWAENEEAARDKMHKLWREAPTVGQWEQPDSETEYAITGISD